MENASRVVQGRKSVRKQFIVVGLIAIVSAAGWAQTNSTFGTGQWLHDCWVEYQHPGDRDSTFLAGFYEGFVLGVCYTGSGPVLQLWDTPRTATIDQVCRIVGKYLDSHPEEWNKKALVLVGEAMTNTWPYKK